MPHLQFGACYNAVSTIKTNREECSGVGAELVRLTKAVKSAIEHHARLTRPEECCGLLSGVDGVITDAHPLRNEAESPETRYFASPEDLFAAMKTIRQSGQKLLGIYHSHPRSHAYPSSTDVEMAFYPETAYFILSLEPSPDLRAYRIGGSIQDLVISVVESNG
jgi:proteasome lid subunit RPN8/RPN11